MTYTGEYNLLVVDEAGVVFKADVATPDEAEALIGVLTEVGVAGCRTAAAVGYRIITAILLALECYAVREYE